MISSSLRDATRWGSGGRGPAGYDRRSQAPKSFRSLSRLKARGHIPAPPTGRWGSGFALRWRPTRPQRIDRALGGRNWRGDDPVRPARLSRGTTPGRSSEDLPQPDKPKSVISLAPPCARRAEGLDQAADVVVAIGSASHYSLESSAMASLVCNRSAQIAAAAARTGQIEPKRKFRFGTP
jgi:hypothetical protein